MATAVNLSASWQAPGPSQLNITDCNTVVEYYADQISIIGAGGFLNNSKLGDMGVALAFLDAMVPDEWPGSNPSTENEMIDYYQNLMMWYFRVWENTTLMSTPDYELVENNIQNLAYGCNLAICDKLEVKGDPDISGRGMMATYYIAAGLTTLYFIVLTMERFGLFDGRMPKLGVLHRTVTAFKSSVNDFLDTALIFAAAMLGATIARYAIYRQNNELMDADDVFTYPLLGSAFIAVFSIFPCLALQTVADFSKWRFLRLVIWCTIVALAIAMEALFRPTFDDFFDSIRTYRAADGAGIYSPGILRAIIWETQCEAESRTQELRTLVKAGLIIQASNLIWFAYTILFGLMVAYRRHQKKDPSRILRHYKDSPEAWKEISSILRTLVGIECLVMMWVYLAYFVLYRAYVKKRAPSTNRDSDWSFGQVLALAQWLPTFLMFIFSWKMGDKRAQEEGVAESYKPLDSVQADRFSTNGDKDSQELRIL